MKQHIQIYIFSIIVLLSGCSPTVSVGEDTIFGDTALDVMGPYYTSPVFGFTVSDMDIAILQDAEPFQNGQNGVLSSGLDLLTIVTNIDPAATFRKSETNDSIIITVTFSEDIPAQDNANREIKKGDTLDIILTKRSDGVTLSSIDVLRIPELVGFKNQIESSGVGYSGPGIDIGGTNNGDTDTGGIDNGGTDTGGTDNGGTDTGGTDNGGSNNGGSNNGGSNNGGSNNGGSNNGGSNNGGSNNGGSNNGGSNNGGSNNGGSNNGGSNNGGSNNGGSNNGGSNNGGSNNGGSNNGGSNNGGSNNGGSNNGGSNNGGSNNGGSNNGGSNNGGSNNGGSNNGGSNNGGSNNGGSNNGGSNNGGSNNGGSNNGGSNNGGSNNGGSNNGGSNNGDSNNGVIDKTFNFKGLRSFGGPTQLMEIKHPYAQAKLKQIYEKLDSTYRYTFEFSKVKNIKAHILFRKDNIPLLYAKGMPSVQPEPRPIPYKLDNDKKDDKKDDKHTHPVISLGMFMHQENNVLTIGWGIHCIRDKMVNKLTSVIIIDGKTGAVKFGPSIGSVRPLKGSWS